MTIPNLDLQVALYASMYRIRHLEEQIAARYSEQKMRCPTHLSIGQEAVAAAAGLALRKQDQAFSTHRAHAHYVGKGGCLKKMMAEIYGKSTGCARGKGGSMHLIDREVGFSGSTAIVGNSIPLAVGAALANQVKANGLICAVFFGDAAVEEGAFHESINFAALKKLPVLFLCENNLYSVYSPLQVRQPEGRPIWKFAQGYGVAASLHDGNDATACFEAIQQAAEVCRTGGGPYFMEFSTYRWREHCGPHYDNDIGYRTTEEFEKWKLGDPVAAQRARLTSLGVPMETVAGIEKDIDAQVNEAFDHADASPFPEAREAYEGVYREDIR